MRHLFLLVALFLVVFTICHTKVEFRTVKKPVAPKPSEMQVEPVVVDMSQCYLLWEGKTPDLQK